jgi:hypothetical protein
MAAVRSRVRIARSGLGMLCAALGGLSTIASCSSDYGATDDAKADGGFADGSGGGGGDGGADGTPPEEGATQCNIGTSFNTAVPLTELNLGDSFNASARLSQDEGTIYFTSARTNKLLIYFATRAGVGTPGARAPFSVPTLLPNVNPPNQQLFSPTVSPDGKTLAAVLRTDDRDGGNTDAGTTDSLVQSVRTAVGTPFPPATISGFSFMEMGANAGTNGSPYLVTSNRLYFSSTRSGNGDLFVGDNTQNGQWIEQAPLLALNDNSAIEDFPVVSSDELTIYFASNRRTMNGNMEIYRSSRAKPSDVFEIPVVVPELAGTGSNVPTWISPDLCRLYFSRDKALFVATREIPVD